VHATAVKRLSGREVLRQLADELAGQKPHGELEVVLARTGASLPRGVRTGALRATVPEELHTAPIRNFGALTGHPMRSATSLSE
jgi:hypothetical protein